MKTTFHTLRRITGAVLLLAFIGLPFAKVNGQSALRFDIPTLRLLIFGTEIWMADFFIVLVATIFLAFFILFTTTVFGRVWCGWLCPQTVLIDAAAFSATRRRAWGATRVAPAATALAASAVVSASLIGYFVAPSDALRLIREGGTAASIIIGSWITIGVLLYLDLVFVGRKFCAAVCPYARLQSVLFDERTLAVAFDKARAGGCERCMACVNACPAGIDIRKGAQVECIQCAECVDACAERMGKSGRKSLVRYAFGMSGSQRTGVRVNALITGIIALLFVLFLIYLSATRMPFDMGIRLMYPTVQKKQQNAGEIENIYELSIRNMTDDDLLLELEADMPDGEVSISPSSVVVPEGEDIIRIPVIVTLGSITGKQNRTVTLTATSPPENKSISREIVFLEK